MAKEIHHWSYSSISQYLRCPRQFFFQRILGLPVQTTTAPQVLGSAVHVALAWYHRALRDGHDLHGDVMEGVYLHAWETETQRREVITRDGANVTDAIEQGLALLARYRRESTPAGIESIESLFVVPLVTSSGEILKRPLYAIVDLLARNRHGLTIHEFKTLARSMSQQEADSTLQATCYTHAIRELCREEAPVEYVCLVKTKEPRIKRLTTTRTELEATRLGDLVQSIERAIQADVFYPIESPFNCSGCPFRKECRTWGCSPTPITADLPIGVVPIGC